MLIVGEIGKPHGVSGEVHVVRISDDPRRFESGSVLVHADGRSLEIESARSHRDRLLVKFAGIDDREGAEGLRGALYVDSSKLRDLDEDEFWAHDIVGCRVFVRGESLGSVTRLIPGVAQDLIEVATDRGPRLIPFVDEFVTDVDVRGKRIDVDPPEGLLE